MSYLAGRVPSGTGDDETIVVGASLAGLTTAFELADAGREVLLLGGWPSPGGNGLVR